LEWGGGGHIDGEQLKSPEITPRLKTGRQGCEYPPPNQPPKTVRKVGLCLTAVIRRIERL